MKIERIELHLVELDLVHPFETSFGREVTRECILVSMHGEGISGWAESATSGGPWYSYETPETNWHLIRDFLAPLVLGQEVEAPADVARRFQSIRGHPMARSAVENAAWDLFGRARGMALSALLGGGFRQRVPVGVSVGIEPTVEELLAQVAAYVAAGYRRVKLKIKPGWDIAPVRAVRERWPNLPLQVDANAAYTPADTGRLAELDQYNLLLIEQPYHHDDLVDHARLQGQLRTPVCLDESIQSPQHARWALELGACRVINIKVGRVGGLSAAVEIHDLCQARGVPVWCGGMLETNIGRAANVALASLPNFSLPGDISASSRYFHQDIAKPGFELNADSTISLPSGPGLGVEAQLDRITSQRLRHLTLTAR